MRLNLVGRLLCRCGHGGVTSLGDPMRRATGGLCEFVLYIVARTCARMLAYPDGNLRLFSPFVTDHANQH